MFISTVKLKFILVVRWHISLHCVVFVVIFRFCMFTFILNIIRFEAVLMVVNYISLHGFYLSLATEVFIWPLLIGKSFVSVHFSCKQCGNGESLKLIYFCIQELLIER